MPTTEELLEQGHEACLNEDANTEEISLATPYVGMVFATIDEAKACYEQYAKQRGFCIRQRDMRRNIPRSDQVTTLKLVCAREGKQRQTDDTYSMDKEHYNVTAEADEGSIKGKRGKVRTSSSVRVGCEAAMRVVFERFRGRYVVSVFNDVHNHGLVSPEKRKLMRSMRKIPMAVKALTETFQAENIRVSSLPALFGGDSIGFDSRDCYNHLRKLRHKVLELGDAQSVLNFFQKKQAQNPQFYYAIQCDEEGRAVNFFWVDGRSRMAYKCFGDVVTFDTTYRTNRYDMPFAPFTGVNHHFQSIQYGCALLQDETEDSFVWLFEKWLEAMGGVHPISMITDQDLAMKAAIAKVFPNTRHRLCMWHIKKKFVEKLGHIYQEKSAFQKKMTKCIHWTYSVEDFEEQWRRLMFEYDLTANTWLAHLYEIREAWVPVYLRGIFFAGMNTTGRSESMNSFFDGFVTSRMTLFEFVQKYDKALQQILKNEQTEDFLSEHKQRVVDRRSFLLYHAAQVYTRSIWIKFKHEYDGVLDWRIDEGQQSDDHRIFHVTTRDYVKHPQSFVVCFNRASHQCTCQCQMFEFSGMICRHILKILIFKLDVEKIPEALIHVRWRKGANKFRGMDRSQLVIDAGSEYGEALRLNHLSQEMSNLACISAAHHETYLMALEMVNDTMRRVDAAIDSILSRRARAESASDGLVEENARAEAYPSTQNSTAAVASNNPELRDSISPIDSSSEFRILDPRISQTKGRKKGKEIATDSGRMKSGLEIATKKRKRMCRSCKKLSRHDSRNCPLNANKRKKDVDSSSSDEPDASKEEDDGSSDQ